MTKEELEDAIFEGMRRYKQWDLERKSQAELRRIGQFLGVQELETERRKEWTPES